MDNKILIFLITLMMFTGCSGTSPDLGINNGKLMPCPKTPNCVNSQAKNNENYIEPIHFTGTQQEAKDRLLRTLESEKRTKVITDKKDYIRVEFTSALFRFVDDVEFYFMKKQADTTIIHIRSASRIGYSDLGVNRKRIEKIRNKFLVITKNNSIKTL